MEHSQSTSSTPPPNHQNNLDPPGEKEGHGFLLSEDEARALQNRTPLPFLSNHSTLTSASNSPISHHTHNLLKHSYSSIQSDSSNISAGQLSTDVPPQILNVNSSQSESISVKGQNESQSESQSLSSSQSDLTSPTSPRFLSSSSASSNHALTIPESFIVSSNHTDPQSDLFSNDLKVSSSDVNITPPSPSLSPAPTGSSDNGMLISESSMNSSPRSHPYDSDESSAPNSALHTEDEGEAGHMKIVHRPRASKKSLGESPTKHHLSHQQSNTLSIDSGNISSSDDQYESEDDPPIPIKIPSFSSLHSHINDGDSSIQRDIPTLNIFKNRKHARQHQASRQGRSKQHDVHHLILPLHPRSQLQFETPTRIGVNNSTTSNDSLVSLEDDLASSLHKSTHHIPREIRSLPILFHIFMVLSISMMAFGSYAAYDAVGALQTQLMNDLQISVQQFGLLYSIYALPNIFLVIFGGKLTDKFGTISMALATTGLVALGSMVVALSPSLPLSPHSKFYFMLFGRLIFGVGAETSYVVQNSMCVEWYLGDYLATVMSIAASVARLGSVLAFVCAPWFSSYKIALWVASFTCIASFAFSIVGAGLIIFAKRKLLPASFDDQSFELESSLPSSPNGDDTYLSEGSSPKGEYVSDFLNSSSISNSSLTVSSDELLPPKFHHNDSKIKNLADTLDSRRSNEDNDSGNVSDGSSTENGGTLENDTPRVSMQHQRISRYTLSIWNGLKKAFIETFVAIRGFSAMFYVSVLIGTLTYGCILSFRAESSDSIAEIYHMTPKSVGMLLASIDTTSLFVAPVVGILIDYTLKLGIFTAIGSILSLAAFGLLFVRGLNPYFGIIVLGISSTIVPAAIYPAVSYLVDPSNEGLAFGVMSAFINLGNVIFNLIVAYFIGRGWNFSCAFLAFISLVAVTASLAWNYKDKQNDPPVLNKPKNWHEEIQKLKSLIESGKNRLFRRTGMGESELQALPTY